MSTSSLQWEAAVNCLDLRATLAIYVTKEAVVLHNWSFLFESVPNKREYKWKIQCRDWICIMAQWTKKMIPRVLAPVKDHERQERQLLTVPEYSDKIDHPTGKEENILYRNELTPRLIVNRPRQFNCEMRDVGPRDGSSGQQIRGMKNDGRHANLDDHQAGHASCPGCRTSSDQDVEELWWWS